MDRTKFSRTMGGGTKDKPVSHWGKGAPRVRTKAFWTDAMKWDREFARWREQPCAPHLRPAVEEHAKRIRPRVFPSLCDWLDGEVPIHWLADFLKLMNDAANLDWLLLTKRPEHWRPRLEQACDWLLNHSRASSTGYLVRSLTEWIENHQPPEHLWIGVSCEDQQRADERIPHLLGIPAKIRFLSVEPLLSPIDLSGLIFKPCRCGARGLSDCSCLPVSSLDWIIIGGESGNLYRRCEVKDIEDVARQCIAAGVRCFVKQDCGLKPSQRGRISDEIWALKQFPNTSG